MCALVVEDEMTIALLIEDMLTDLGHEVAALTMRLPQALEAARREAIDFAVLDVNLDGRHSYAVADALAARDVPVIFASGYGPAGLEAAYRDRVVIKKPFLIADLRRAIERVTRAAG